MPENNTETADEKLLILPLGEESKKITQVISSDTARQVIELLADAPLSASDIAERLKTPLTTVIYNLENLESVGLVKVEKIKYSEKGRKVKIYAPVRKVIVVVPEKTDRESVLDVLRRYMGVVLAAVLASSVVEFFTRGYSRRAGIMDISATEIAPEAILSEVPVAPEAFIEEEMLEESAKVAESFEVPESVTGMPDNATAEQASAPFEPLETFEPLERATDTLPAPEQPIESAMTQAPAPSPIPADTFDVSPLAQPEPGILSNIADTILAHPGLVFLLGCLFIITALIIFDIIRRRKDR